MLRGVRGLSPIASIALPPKSFPRHLNPEPHLPPRFIFWAELARISGVETFSVLHPEKTYYGGRVLRAVVPYV